MGQIYIPVVNWVLLCAVLIAVLGFGSSSRLASAYGVAVMGTMIVTTILAFFVVRYRWGYPLLACVLPTAFFLVIDLAFFTAALHKLLDGGWFPLALGAAVFAVMMTWRGGRERLLEQIRRSSVPIAGFLESLGSSPPQRVPGTAIFLTSTPDATPHALLHSLKHYKTLHENNVFLTVEYEDTPTVDLGRRVTCEPIGNDAWRVIARFGFMESPDIASALELCAPHGLKLEPMEVSYFLSREKIVSPPHRGRVRRWRDGVFAAMARNAAGAPDFFSIPANRVVELGTRIEL
jgi:KUP system potassium uptake protein